MSYKDVRGEIFLLCHANLLVLGDCKSGHPHALISSIRCGHKDIPAVKVFKSLRNYKLQQKLQETLIRGSMQTTHMCPVTVM